MKESKLGENCNNELSYIKKEKDIYDIYVHISLFFSVIIH